jgi:hypothetical protein
MQTDKRYFFIPFFVLFLPVITGSLTGYFKEGSMGGDSLLSIFYRGFIMLYSCIYLFRNRVSKYIYCLFAAILISQLYQVLMGYFTLSGLFSLTKVLYVFCVLSILLGSRYCSNIRYVFNCAIGCGVVTALILIYSFIFQTGYGRIIDGGFGVRGFFIAMNDVGLTIILLNVLSCFFYLKTNEIKYLIASLLMTIGASLVGTRACYVGTLGIIVCFLLNVVFIKFKDYRSSTGYKIITLLVVLLSLNIAIRQIINIITIDAHLSIKYQNFDKDFTAMSARSPLIDAGIKVLDEYSLLDWIFGTGTNFSNQMLHKSFGGYQHTEVDPIDLVGRYGLVFSILLIGFSVWFLWQVIKHFWFQRDILSYWLIVGILLYIGHAAYAGHAYTSPLPSTYFAVYLYLFFRKKNVIL